MKEKTKKLIGTIWSVLSGFAIVAMFLITTSSDIGASDALEKEKIIQLDKNIAIIQPKIDFFDRKSVEYDTMLISIQKNVDNGTAMIKEIRDAIKLQNDLVIQTKTQVEGMKEFWLSDSKEIKARLVRIEDKADGIR